MNRSGSITYRVSFSIKGGKRHHRGFDTLQKAEQFQKLINEKADAGKKAELVDIAGAYRHEILAGVEKLKTVGATITEAVDFYLKYAKPVHGETTVQEGVTAFLAEKRKMGRSQKYLRNCEDIYFAPFQRKFYDRMVNELLGSEIIDYLVAQEWSNNTKNFHRNYLSTLYGWWIKRGYAKRNPMKDVDPFDQADPPIRVLPTVEVRRLLDHAFNTKHFEECASMVLVFYCGVRVDEVDRMNWEDIDFEGRYIILEGAITKKGKRRQNRISDNAYEWLDTIREGLRENSFLRIDPTGRIAPSDYTQRMRRLRRAAGLDAEDYPQNSMRHSFCSYHTNFFQRPRETAWMLGHPDPQLLYNTYNGLVTPSEARRFWQIYPPTVAGQEKEDEIAQDKAWGTSFNAERVYPDQRENS
jgi:integrase